MFPWTAGKWHDAKIGDTTITYWVHPDQVHIASVRTPASKRRKGSARRAMEAFLAAVDRDRRMPVHLLASPLDKRTTLARLVRFYQSLGFQLTGQTGNMAKDPVLVRPAAAASEDAEEEEEAWPKHRIGVAELPSQWAGARAPDVDQWARDLMDHWSRVTPDTLRADYGDGHDPATLDVYFAYVPVEQVPRPVLAEVEGNAAERQRCLREAASAYAEDEDDEAYEAAERECDDLYPEDGGYDWSELQAGGAPPPPKLWVDAKGRVTIVDGNHRLTFWGSQGRYTHYPVWVLQERPKTMERLSLPGAALIALDLALPDPVPGMPGPITAGVLAMERLPIGASVEVEVGHDVFTARAIVGGKRVGHAQASTYDEDYLEGSCEFDIGLLREELGTPQAPAYVLWRSGLDEVARGKGLGVAMYEALLAKMHEHHRGPVILFPEKCMEDGDTSEDASRVWSSLRKRYVYSGEALSSVRRGVVERLPVAVSGGPPGQGMDYAYAMSLHKMYGGRQVHRKAQDEAIWRLGEVGVHLIEASLGCGFYACAYALRDAPDWVIKLTGDPTEAAAWQNVLALGHLPGLARTRLVFAFPPSAFAPDRRLFGIVQERLRPLPPGEHALVYEFGQTGSIVEAADVPANEPMLLDAARTYWRENGYHVPVGAHHLADFLANLRRLAKRGIRTEDIHGDNVMSCTDGAWCIVDLGSSEGEATTVPELEDVVGSLHEWLGQRRTA